MAEKKKAAPKKKIAPKKIEKKVEKIIEAPIEKKESKPLSIEGHKVLSVSDLDNGCKLVKAANGCEYTLPKSEYDLLVK